MQSSNFLHSFAKHNSLQYKFNGKSDRVITIKSKKTFRCFSHIAAFKPSIATANVVLLLL